MKSGQFAILFLAVQCFFTGVVKASDSVSLIGVLIEPPLCTIVDDKQFIDINFGPRVGITRVDGQRYKKIIPYKVTCEKDSNPWEMQLTLRGDITDYDNAALQTNMPNLGIRMLLNGKPFEVNKAVPVDPANLPVMEAVPVKSPGSTLTQGLFWAFVTLQAEYQ